MHPIQFTVRYGKLDNDTYEMEYTDEEENTAHRECHPGDGIQTPSSPALSTKATQPSSAAIA